MLRPVHGERHDGRGAALWAFTAKLLFVAALLIGMMLPANASQPDGRPWFTWASFDRPCGGGCGLAVYGGRFLDTDMREVFGGIFGADQFVPPHQWDVGEDGIIAGAFSRRIASLAGVIDFEAEIGAAQRFGEDNETEGWAALYVRWTYFPWNHWVKTTAAVSTGYNYASGVSELELAQGRRGAAGSKLLHFQSPELTLALPDVPETELLIRLHHRSGGREILGNLKVFKGTGGGSQYITVGLRQRF